MGWRLRAEKPVRVYYLKGSFTSAEAGALSRGVNNWNTALREIDSPVTFLNGGELDAVSVEGATVTVVRGIPRGKERVGEIRFFTKPNGSVRMTVVVSPTVTDLSALTSLMTHELGHAMGLAPAINTWSPRAMPRTTMNRRG
jgi:predicted Zn-dependent protease